MTNYRISHRWRVGASQVTYPVGGAYSLADGIAWFDQWKLERGNTSAKCEVTPVRGKISGVWLKERRR